MRTGKDLVMAVPGLAAHAAQCQPAPWHCQAQLGFLMCHIGRRLCAICIDEAVPANLARISVVPPLACSCRPAGKYLDEAISWKSENAFSCVAAIAL